jgi:hypothetical protein
MTNSVTADSADTPYRQTGVGSAIKLLASESNPDGWALDELLAQIRTEFEVELLALDGREPAVRNRLFGYEKVIAALWEAEGRYRVLGSHRKAPR